ncbi:MAG: hypothetical protein ACR2KT_10175 [Methylocella sp.]
MSIQASPIYRSGFFGIVLQVAHGRSNLAPEVALAGEGHAAGGILFQMFLHQLVAIAIRRIGRQKIKPQIPAESFNECRGLPGAMRRAAIVRWRWFRTAGMIVHHGWRMLRKIGATMLDVPAAIGERRAGVMREGGAISETA